MVQVAGELLLVAGGSGPFTFRRPLRRFTSYLPAATRSSETATWIPEVLEVFEVFEVFQSVSFTLSVVR
jgi:hypothetical protein